MEAFVRIATELSVESFNSIKMSGATAGNPYQAVDSLARLLIILVSNRNAAGEANEDTQLEIARSAFSVIVLVLIHMQEVNPNDFDQKTFLRLFSSILNDLKPIQLENSVLYRKLLFLMSEMFYSLRPLIVPAFSFSWIQLISHRNFLSCILLVDDHEVNISIFWVYLF